MSFHINRTMCRRKRIKWGLVLGVFIVRLFGSVAEEPIGHAATQEPTGFATEFNGCVESIGVTLVPTDRARRLVPTEFQLVGDGTPVTPLVVRTARCTEIAVAGYRPKAGLVVQIGLVIVPPDFTGDINNYTLWYYTSDAKLAHHLEQLGVAAQHVPTIDYDYAPGASAVLAPLFVAVPQPGAPTVTLVGTATESNSSSASFVANWWQKGSLGTVKMNTNVPSIFVGSANLTLTTDPEGELGQLIGGGSTGFQLLQQFNAFPRADGSQHRLAITTRVRKGSCAAIRDPESKTFWPPTAPTVMGFGFSFRRSG